MTFLSILIALLLERITPQLVEYRQFRWLREYSQWLIEVLHIQRLGSWTGLGILLLPLLSIIWLLSAMFDNALFGLFELAFNIAVVFLCLGPKELDRQVDQYLDAIEVGDTQQRFNMAGRLTRETPAMELSNQVVQVCKALFVEANRRIYAILFWFILLGPVAVVLYRVLEQLLHQNVLERSLIAIKHNIRFILGWIDWLPARITLFTYMVSGSFEEGQQAFKRGSLGAVDTYEQNSELLQNVGYHSVSAHDEVLNDDQAMQRVRKSRGLILRSLVVWLLIVLTVGFIV